MSDETYRSSAIRYVSSEIERMADSLELGDQVAKMALRIYHQMLESEYDPPSLDGAATACLYLANQTLDQTATLSDVAQVSRKDQKRVSTVSKSLQDELALPGIKIQTPEDVVEAKTTELGIEEHTDDLKHLLQQVDDQYKGSTSPSSVAGAALYIGAEIFGYDRTQAEIADACNVTPVTIRHRYPELFEHSPITPPPGKRRFRTYEEGLETLREELELSDEIYERVEARITLAKQDLDAAVNKGGVVLAAILVTVEELGVREDIADPTELSQYAKVTEQTINKHKEAVER